MTPAHRYNTTQVAAKDRFDFWREAVCNSYVKLGCDKPQINDFKGKLEVTHHSSMSISQVSGSAHAVERRKRDIRTSSDAFFLLSLQTRNTSRITQFGNSSLLKPGDMGLYDSTQPYRLELGEGFSQTVVQLPKDRLLARLPNAQMLGGVRIDGQSGIGKLVSQNILSFSEELTTQDRTISALLQNTLIDLIATGLATGINTAVELASPEQHILLRARSFIAAHIGNPELDRNLVAREIGLSVRRLGDIFAKDGTSIARDIRIKRLHSVTADFEDPRFSGMTISEIAMKNGFSNLQHFSNLFRKAYGQTPKAYRANSA